MKSIIAMTVGLFQICTAIAAPTSTDNNGTTIDPPNLSYTAIVVNNDIDLELSESSDMQLEVEAVQPLAAQVKYVVKDDVLYIKSTGQSLKGKVRVKVKVNKLRELIINGRSNIISKGTLQSSKLNIVVNDEATLHLTSAGKLILEAGEGININIKEDKSKGNYLVL